MHPDVRASSGGESHPSALSDPDMRLSPHPAPILQPPSECHTAWPQTPAPPLAGWLASSVGVSGPFAPPALPGFITTTDPSVPVSRFGTLVLAGASRLDFSLCIETQVPTFHARARLRVTPPPYQMPSGPKSGHPDSSRVMRPPGFDIVYTFSTRHQWFAFARLSEPHLTRSGLAFSVTLTTTAF